MNILGISAFYHDSAAALVRDGAVIAAAQEERFSRSKHDQRFPKNAVRYCLDVGGVSVKDIEYFVFYDKPLLKFERLRPPASPAAGWIHSRSTFPERLHCNSLGLSHRFDCWPHLAEQYIGVIHIAAERELFRLGASIEALMRCGGHERP
jgi:predicted NodU family carbamoyl transferase